MSVIKLILNLLLSLGLSSIVAIFFLYLVFFIEMTIAFRAQCNSAFVFMGVGMEPPIYSESSLICKMLFEYGGQSLILLIPALVGIGSFIAMILHLKKKGFWLK